MRKLNYISLILILTFLISTPFTSFSKEKEKKNRSKLSKVATNPSSNVIDINTITCWVGSDGFHDWVINSSWNGQYPKGSNVGAIFAEGIVWGGKVNDGQSPLVRVNGNTYGTGCQSVFNPGRVFKVRPDYKTGNLADDAANFNNISLGQVSQGDIDALRAQYETDWNDWPVNQGAPYTDVDNNGTYDPNIDIPGVPGAAQTLFTKYNDALSSANYGSAPIGLEIAETYWAYAYTGALGNVIYKKVDMVYKGTSTSAANSTINDMYIVQWADPDVGVSSDDFAGCDTALNLGYAYTAQDQDGDYPNGPPAVGYDFLQGVSQPTGNLNDSAIVNLKWRKGYKYVNAKPMSSFIYFAAGGHWSDPSFDYTGTLEFYNLMRGYLPEPKYPSGEPFPVGVADVTSTGTYLLDGDPVTDTGKLDGNTTAGGDSQGDRRIMVVNGPINMKLGDTVEVVLAMVGGLGTNNKDAVAQMKKNDNTAQIVFDQLFQLPTLSPPNVHVEQLDKQVVLDWGSDKASLDKIENFSSQGYNFEGYQVYQLPTSSSALSDGVLLATYDLADGITTIVDTVEESGVLLGQISIAGSDNGIQRYLSITKDALRGNQALHNGQEYYFAVVPYAFNPSPLLPFHALQSGVEIKVAVPQQPLGVRTGGAVGDTIQTAHTTGKSDGESFALVVDPSRTTGHSYKVSFNTDAEANTTWSLTDVNTGEVKASDESNQSGDGDYPIIDGLQVKVIGPQPAVKGYTFTPSADRWFTGYSGLGGEAFFGGLTIGPNFFGSSVTPDQYVKVEIRFTTDVANGQKAYRYLRGGTPNYGYQDYTQQHFTVWNVDANPPVQLAAAYVEQSGNASANSLWEPTASTSDREYLFIFNTPYTDQPDPFYTDKSILADAGSMPILYALWPLQRGTMPYNPQDGQVFTIIPNYPNVPADVFSFTAPSVTSGTDLQKADADKVNVFPNPYYGFQNRETARDAKYVTFSHLPAQATLRIFDLSGVLVKTLTKNDPSQFTTWNLQNDNGYPVASGVYIIYIDMPGLGTTKVLKLALVQEEQILRVY